MSSRKCCVGGCISTSETHRLFSIPKDDKLRELWMSFLIPTNIELSGLSKDQLLNKRVCQNHFDRHQFDGKGNRLQHGYPCLFTEKEVLHGIPLTSSVGDHLIDHNYELKVVPDDSIESTVNIVIEGDHSYTSASLPVEESMEEGPSKNVAPIRIKSLGEHSSISGNLPVREYMEVDACQIFTPMKVKSTAVQKISRKRLIKSMGYIQRVKKITLIENRTEKPFQERLSRAKDLSQDNSFVKNFNKMTKHAQDFLLMQLKLADKKKKAIRFTTDEKLLSLTLMKESPKGYRLLKKIFKLPSKRTLNRLAEKIKFRVGINDNIFKQLEKKSLYWDTKKKLCSIVFDEVALQPHLTYVEAEDQVQGFKDLGEQKELKFSDHALVIMIRGVCSNWRQPICYYFCEGTTSSAALIRILKEVVARVAKSGLIPIAFVCDQGSTFRTAMKMLMQETQCKRSNREHHDGTIEISKQQLSIVYDPPHLLKGLRNNLLSKNMLFKGKIASWDDILTVYNSDCQLGHTRMNKKLTAHHVIADKMKKMKVRIAAQVLSAQTSAMLKYTSLFKTTTSGENVSETMGTTGEAVEFIDKLFDSVNGSQRGTVRGKLRGPIKKTSQHFAFWREAREILRNIRFVDSTSKRAITNKKQYYVRVPSLDGWITTLESIERICKSLFEKYNVQYVYPRNINQDPLENFFGRIRAINYRNTNPDAYTFINSFKSLLISNVMGPHSIYSNCEDDDGETLIDFFNLLKQTSNEDKENIPVSTNIMPKDIKIEENAKNVINEKMRVHSSAYTAGYLCRKMTKKFNCANCTNTYIAKEKENIHEWIMHREYKQLKNSNLAYPSKKFLILYRDIADYIHSYMNSYAHNRNIGENIKKEIKLKYNLNWIGCTIHKPSVINWFLKLILRLHIHNWCNIINKILKGAIEEPYVNKMISMQNMAFNKYKALRVRCKINKS